MFLVIWNCIHIIILLFLCHSINLYDWYLLNFMFYLFLFFLHTYRERDLLEIPSNTGSLRLVQWPLFLLSSKVFLVTHMSFLWWFGIFFQRFLSFFLHSFSLIFQILLAIDLAFDCKDTQAELWSRISRDEYMAYAVKECYYSIEKILHSLVVEEGALWYELFFYLVFLIQSEHLRSWKRERGSEERWRGPHCSCKQTIRFYA